MKRSRKAKHLTQQELSDIIHINHGTISRYESGLVDIPATALVSYGEGLDYEPKNYLAWEDVGVEDVLFLLEQADVKPEEKKRRKPFDPNESIRSWVPSGLGIDEEIYSLDDEEEDEELDLPDEVIDMAHAYKLLSDSQCDFEILEPLRNEIIGLIETKTEMSKESLMRRLIAYLDI